MAETFKKDDYFKIDVECHVIGDQALIEHYPGVKMWWGAVKNLMSPLWTCGLDPEINASMEPREFEKQHGPDVLIEYMDKYGVDIACLLPESMLETTNYTHVWSTAVEAKKWADQYPDRFLVQPNLSPIKFRGIKAALFDLEYWVNEMGAKVFKYYPPEDTYMNDPVLWPVYEKAQELGIVLDIHTGFSWVPPGKSKYALPIQIDDVARDFPELVINCFHMGYPYCDDMNMVAMAHPNVYVSVSLLVPWALNAPRKFAAIIGEALRFVGPDKITWGTDYVGLGRMYNYAVQGLRDFQIPEDMQRDYGYPALTDEIKAKIFGGNMARLLGIDSSRRRVKM